MARLLGSFMDDEELDRPDLNKCPDCECYFPQDNCPICGKECPEEMRAGNRKKQKKKKARNGRSKTVQYIDWYHRWWFIIIMLIVFPIIGIILLFGSPYKKGVKLAIAAVAIVYAIGSYYGFGRFFGQITEMFDQPVNTSLSRDEYMDKCTWLSGEDYYRRSEDHKGDFVKIVLTVKNYVNTSDHEYYLCEYSDGQKVYEIYIRDCVQDNSQRLTIDDVIIVYGECAGNVSIVDYGLEYDEGPCINAAYIELKK